MRGIEIEKLEVCTGYYIQRDTDKPLTSSKFSVGAGGGERSKKVGGVSPIPLGAYA